VFQENIFTPKSHADIVLLLSKHNHSLFHIVKDRVVKMSAQCILLKY